MLGKALPQRHAAARSILSCCNSDAHALDAAAAACWAAGRHWLQQGMRPCWQQILCKPAERRQPMLRPATASAAGAVQRCRQLCQLGDAHAALKR